MGKVHRQYSPTFKAKVVLEVDLCIQALEKALSTGWLNRCSKDDTVTFGQRSL